MSSTKFNALAERRLAPKVIWTSKRAAVPYIWCRLLPMNKILDPAIWPPEGPLKRYSLFAYGFNKALITADGITWVE